MTNEWCKFGESVTLESATSLRDNDVKESQLTHADGSNQEHLGWVRALHETVERLAHTKTCFFLSDLEDRGKKNGGMDSGVRGGELACLGFTVETGEADGS